MKNIVETVILPLEEDDDVGRRAAIFMVARKHGNSSIVQSRIVRHKAVKTSRHDQWGFRYDEQSIEYTVELTLTPKPRYRSSK